MPTTLLSVALNFELMVLALMTPSVQPATRENHDWRVARRDTPELTGEPATRRGGGGTQRREGVDVACRRGANIRRYFTVGSESGLAGKQNSRPRP